MNVLVADLGFLFLIRSKVALCLVFVSDLGFQFFSVVTVDLFLRVLLSLDCLCLRIVSVS